MKMPRLGVVIGAITAFACLFPFAASAGGDDAPGAAPAAGDPEIDEVLARIEAFTQDGTFPGETHQTWWKTKMDPFINAYSQDTGVSQNVLTLILDGETEGNGALQTVNTALEQFGLACASYDVVKNLAEGRQDLAFYTTAKTVLSDLLGRLGRGGKLGAATVGIYDYVLTQLGETAVETSNQAWWNAYLEFQTSERSDDDWIKLYMDGGWAAVAKEADRFWAETERLRGDAFFKVNNPNHVADYRARFVRHWLLPRLQGWLEAEKAMRRREAADRCRELRAAMSRATVRVIGTVVNTATRASAHRLEWRVRLCRPDGRELARDQVSDSDHFELVGDLKDLPDGQFRILVELASEATDAPEPNAEVLGAIGVPEGNQTAPREIKRSGFNVVVHLHDIPVNAYVRRPEPPPPRDLWTVPGPLPDELPGHAARLEALWQSYQARQLPLEALRQAVALELRGAEASFRVADARRTAIGQALEHNRRRLEHPFVRPDSPEEGDAGPEVTARVENEYRPKIAAAQAEARAGKQKWGELDQLWSGRMAQEYAAHQRQLEAARQALRAAQNEAQPLVAEVAAARDEARTQLQAWAEAREAVRFDDRTGAPGIAAEDVGRLEALAADGTARFQATAQRIEAAAGQLRAAAGVLAERQRVVSELLAADYGVPAGVPAALWTREEGESVRCEQAAEEVVAVRQLIQDAQVPAKLQRAAESFKRLAARRRAQMAEAAAFLAQLEQAVAQCPGVSAIEACAHRYYNLWGGGDTGLMAYRRALVAGAAPTLPKEICDEAGDDTAFWRRQAAAQEQFGRDNLAIVGDLLPPPLTQPTALGDAVRASRALWDRRDDLTFEQAKKLDELEEGLRRLEGARGAPPLGGIEWRMAAVRFLAAAGDNAAQRWAAIGAANRELQARAEAARAAAGRLPRCGLATPEADVRAAHAAAVELLRSLDADNVPSMFITADTFERVGDAQSAVAASGVWVEMRRVEQRPALPAEIRVGGRTMPLDGRCVRLKQAASGDFVNFTMATPKNLCVESSTGRWGFSRGPGGFLAGGDTFMGIRVERSPVPIVWRVAIRVAAPDGSVNSLVAGEPPLILVLEP